VRNEGWTENFSQKLLGRLRRRWEGKTNIKMYLITM
jgi:hypothetical protein